MYIFESTTFGGESFIALMPNRTEREPLSIALAKCYMQTISIPTRQFTSLCNGAGAICNWVSARGSALNTKQCEKAVAAKNCLACIKGQGGRLYIRWLSWLVAREKGGSAFWGVRIPCSRVRTIASDRSEITRSISGCSIGV
jgi:hypothetical protein